MYSKEYMLKAVVYNGVYSNIWDMESIPDKHLTRIKNIGAKLKELRKEAGYSSSESFAFENDIPRVQYGKMERAVNFKIATLMRVLDAHKITLEEFFKGIK